MNMQPEKNYDWHIILNRPHNHCVFSRNVTPADGWSSNDDVVPLHDNITLGWMTSVYRLESDLFDEYTKTSDEQPTPSPAGNNSINCAACGREVDRLKACTACKMVKYCNVACQKAHRPEHKEECKKRAAELLNVEALPKKSTKCFIPFDFAKKIVEEASDEADINYDDEENETFESLEQAISSPYGASLLLANAHLLIDAIEIRNLPNLASVYLGKALDALSKKKYKGIIKGGGDPNEFMALLHDDEGSKTAGEDFWMAAVGQMPKKIVLHVPLPTSVVSDNDMDEITQQIHLAFPHVNVETNRELKDDPSQPVKRLLWACDLARHMKLRFLICNQRSENYSNRSGMFGFGIDRFFRYGIPLKDVPQRPTKWEGTYYYASQLLASRPWSVFAPFEILKVTITKDGEETTRWVMFTSPHGGNQEGDQKSNSPFGSVQIQPELRELTTHFGREDMYLRSGLVEAHHYPDRLYLSADPIGDVHYDTIFLLRHLFGNSISPLTSSRFSGWRQQSKGEETILDFGVVPNIEVQTGPPDAYMTEDAMGRSFGRRPPNDDELDIIPKVVYYCHKFVEERKLLGKSVGPSLGSFERTYPDDFSHSGEPDSVTVTYNLDQKYGGIWDSGRKWMWFD